MHSAVLVQTGPPVGGQPHQVLAQMQGVPTSVIVPAGTGPGSTFMAATANGKMMEVMCPDDCVPGQQIQFMDAPMEGVPTAPRPPDDAAVAHYEMLLGNMTQLVIRDLRKFSEPTKEMAALHMSGRTTSGSVGDLGTLYLVINGDLSDEREFAGSAELQLSDGRVVMQLANPGWRAAQIDQEKKAKTMKEWVLPEVQMMDREGAVRVTDETGAPREKCDECLRSWTPLAQLPKTRVSHPQSADETLRQGYRQVAPASLNFATIAEGKVLTLLIPTLFCPLFILMTNRPPDIHYELQDVSTGSTVKGVRYSEKGRLFCEAQGIYKHGSGGVDTSSRGGLCPRLRIPDGDQLTFSESVPLRVRKDMLTVLVYRLTFASLSKLPEPTDDDKPTEYRGG